MAKPIYCLYCENCMPSAIWEDEEKNLDMARCKAVFTEEPKYISPNEPPREYQFCEIVRRTQEDPTQCDDYKRGEE